MEVTGAGMVDLLDTHSLACLTTIDRPRTRVWEEGFQLYFSIPQWVAGARISMDLGTEVTSVQECWGVMQSCTEMPAECDRQDADDGDLLTFDDGQLTFFLKAQQTEVACVLKGVPPLDSVPVQFEGALPRSALDCVKGKDRRPRHQRATPTCSTLLSQAPIAQRRQRHHPLPLGHAQRQRLGFRAARKRGWKAK